MLHFDLQLHAGAAQLSLPDSDARLDAVSYALALRAQQPLLDAIEAWLGESLDPAPALGATIVVDGVQLQIEGGSLDGPCSLHLPTSALHAPPPPALRDKFTLRWPAWPCEVLLDSVPAERLQAAALHAGCVLLLPRSFGPAWPAQIRMLGRNAMPACAAQWLPELKLLELRGTPTPLRAPNRDATDWQIVFETTAAISAEVLTGLATQVQGWTPPPGDDAVVLLQQGRRRASGRLLPAGRGVGLRVDSVIAFEPALA